MPRNSADVRTVVPGERLTVTVPEAAEMIGVSRAFAYEMVARGELPVVKLGRRSLVPLRALERLLDDPPLAPAR